MQEYSITKELGISKYKITWIRSDSKEVHIELRPYLRSTGICSGCEKKHQGYHSRIKVMVEDRSAFGKRVYLHVFKRRYRCLLDNLIHTERIEWLKLRGRTTRRFSESVSRLTAITTNEEAGWFLGLDDGQVYRIDKEILEEKARRKLNPPPAGINLSVDEVSYRKYHKYLTNVIDTDKRLLIWNQKGRTAEVLNQYYEGIGPESCALIESVAMDGAKTYISSTRQYAVNALIVCDKFHIMQKLNRCVDDVRKKELKLARIEKNEELIELTQSRQRFILLKHKSRLTEKQSLYLERLCAMNVPIYKAMLLKESFLQFYHFQRVEDAKEYLENWIRECFSSGLEAFEIIAESFTNKKTYLLNWFVKKISSAISEGFNNKIKRLKRMAYGYRNIDYFRLKIHQHCGLLNPRIAT